VKSELDIKEINAEAERAGIKANFEMKKASIADATQLQMLKLKTVKEIHSNGSFSSVYLNHTDDQEPIYAIIDKFIAMTKPKK
jgi:hypothetical protein